MNSCALDGGVMTATTPVFGDGLPEPSDPELLAMTDLRVRPDGAPGGAPAPVARRLRTLAISAALVFAMLAYIGMWAAIIGVILASARGLMSLLGAAG